MINPTRFDLQSLRLFLLAAETGSLTKAAERNHITLPAMSKRMAELEKHMECALFVRHARGVELTAAGYGLLEHARNVVHAVNRMANDMGDFSEGMRGHVHVWANTSAVIQFLPDDLGSFLHQHPHVRVSLEERVSERIVDALSAGQADIGIFADNIPSQTLEKFLYRRDRLVLLVPAGHPLASLPEVSFAKTLDYDYVGLSHGSSLLQRLTTAAMAAERTLRLRIQLSSFDGICRMIEAGLGVGILPEAGVRPEILRTSLKPIRLTDSWADRTLWVGVRNEMQLGPEARKLLTHLRCSAQITEKRPAAT